jgi:hypothetical protein
MNELLQPYRIVCDGQTFGHLADIRHALIVMHLMQHEGFEDIYLYQDDDVFPLFSTDMDFKILNSKDIKDANEIILFRIFQDVQL